LSTVGREMRRLLEAMANLVDKMDPPAPVPEPPPPPPLKPLPHMQFKPGSMEWFVRLPPPPSLQDEIRAGRAISMNAMIREIPKTRPPRRPGQQQLRTNGRWSWWAT
jgi:hypothetical protein